MKRSIFLFLILCPTFLFSQFSEEQIIAICDACEPREVHSADLDGDGDQDVLFSSENENKIGWYQNDGQGNFSKLKIISTDIGTPKSTHSSDVDGDGYNDVLSASFDNGLVWFKNDGVGSFSDKKIISEEIDNLRFVNSGDIDGDGDMDILSASEKDHKIAWYENLGEGEFSEQLVITTQAKEAQSVYASGLGTKLILVFLNVNLRLFTKVTKAKNYESGTTQRTNRNDSTAASFTERI